MRLKSNRLTATKFDNIKLEDLIEYGTLTRDEIVFLKKAIADKKNILICGSAGIGKTTLTGALMKELRDTAIVSTMDDFKELPMIPDAPKCNRLNKLLRNSELSYLTIPDYVFADSIHRKEQFDWIKPMMDANIGVIFNLISPNFNDALMRLISMNQISCGLPSDVADFKRYIADTLDIILEMRRTNKPARKLFVYESIRYDESSDQLTIN